MKRFDRVLNCVVFALSLALNGCRTVSDFSAQDLPADYQAKSDQASNRIDLSALAHQSINQNLIYPGDTLKVSVVTGLEEHEPQSWTLRVGDDGAVDVPLVGAVRVAGMGLVDAENAIREVSIERKIFRRPHVSVVAAQRKKIQVRVVGAVEKPGVYLLPAAGSDLLAALVAAGGLSEKSGTEIEIRHPTLQVGDAHRRSRGGVALASFETTPDRPARIVRLDLAEIGDDSTESPPQYDLHVEDGSVVMVREGGKNSISVIGLVRRPDTYEMPAGQEFRVLDALALAGGPTVGMADKVRVIRHPPDADDPITIAVSLRKAKQVGSEDLVLATGDIVVVEETPATMAVETLRGFIRFGFTSAIPGL